MVSIFYQTPLGPEKTSETILGVLLQIRTILMYLATLPWHHSEGSRAPCPVRPAVRGLLGVPPGGCQVQHWALEAGKMKYLSHASN